MHVEGGWNKYGFGLRTTDLWSMKFIPRLKYPSDCLKIFFKIHPSPISMLQANLSAHSCIFNFLHRITFVFSRCFKCRDRQNRITIRSMQSGDLKVGTTQRKPGFHQPQLKHNLLCDLERCNFVFRVNMNGR